MRQDRVGHDDCNNVLLPVQVAVFVTYIDVWKKIAARDELVFEDDALLHKSWHTVFPALKARLLLESCHVLHKRLACCD